MQGACHLIPQEINLVLLRKCVYISIYEIMDSKFWEVTEPQNMREATWLYCLLSLSLLFLMQLDWVPGDSEL